LLPKHRQHVSSREHGDEQDSRTHAADSPRRLGGCGPFVKRHLRVSKKWLAPFGWLPSLRRANVVLAMPTPNARFARLLFVLVSLSLAACASAAREPTTPEGGVKATEAPADADEAKPAAVSPTSPESAEQDFSRAGDELDAMLARMGSSGPSVGTPPKPDTADVQKPATTPTQPVPANAGGTGAGSSTCETVCRAYSSMQNSANRLCELAGHRDPRCLSAQDRLGRAAERLRSACPACEAAKN
jgi:hypothetical protein